MASRAAWWLLAALGLAALAFAASRTREELSRPRSLQGEPFAGAEACRSCHPSHFDSWRRTFHGRMTQRPDDDSVLGAFDERPLSYFGSEARALRGPDGGFVIETHGTWAREDRIVLTIGSRRVQQYVAERDGVRVRLPWAYHVEDQRWFHMNGAFLTPDPPLPLRHEDFERHVTRWNDNCIFCHNVSPTPGKHAAGFDSQVAELGVACEACHGPAEAHAALNQSPLRRYALHLSDKADPSIVNPARLRPERSADLCGRCHGQRLTDDIEAVLREGDPFVPGDDLSRFSEPLWHDTTLNGEPGVFAARFWGDGTPRLTAYEYQGLLQSPCAQRGALTCTSCHGMHEGDPHGQLRASRTGDAMCTHCHEDLAQPQAAANHAQHAETDEVRCTDCHMPQLVYGVMDAHPSHRIELPNPRAARRAERPDACTLCHLEASREWASEARERLWNEAVPSTALPSLRAAGAPEVERALFAGDPVERALAAAAVGRARPRDGALRALYTDALLDVMQHDAYPAIRRLSARSLAALHGAHLREAYRADVPYEERERTVAALRAQLDAPARRAREFADLRAQAPRIAIHIGE